jgi:hypothetical protein
VQQANQMPASKQAGIWLADPLCVIIPTGLGDSKILKNNLIDIKMDRNRKIAMILGLLFIIAMVTSIASFNLLGSILNDSNCLFKVTQNEHQVILAVFFEVIMSMSIVGIAIILYPFLKKYNETLAIGAVGFRIIECTLYVIGIIFLLSILKLGQELVNAGATEVNKFQITSQLLLNARNLSNNVLGAIAFSLSALMYNYLLFQSKLIPRFISGWGFVGAAMYVAAAFLELSGNKPDSILQMVLNLPLAVNEMVLAIWLIAKGFSNSVNESVNIQK